MPVTSARDISLVAATAMEMRAALASLPMCCEALPGDAESFTPAVRYEIMGRGVRPLVCGVGPVNAAFSLGRALGGDPGCGAKVSPETAFCGILNVGIAGTYDAAVAPPGSVVWASAEYWPEYGLRTETGVDACGIGFAQAPEVFDRIALEDPGADEEERGQNALGIMGLSWHNFRLRGGCVTVAGVSGTPELAARLALQTGGLVENMEGFALALGARRAGLPFAEVRAVSNLAGLRPPEGWNMAGALAALGKAMAELFSG